MSEERQRAVFITGAAGGLGRSSTQLLVKKGWQVFAADYDQAALKRLRQDVDVVPVALDVTDTASVKKAVTQVSRKVDGLDGVVNFADAFTYRFRIPSVRKNALARLGFGPPLAPKG